YEERFDEPCGDRRCHLDPAIRLGDPYVWSASERGVDTRFYFDFASGGSLSPNSVPTLVRRVLCVHDASGQSTGRRRNQSDFDVSASPDRASGNIPTALEADQGQDRIVELGRASEVAHGDVDVMDRAVHVHSITR